LVLAQYVLFECPLVSLEFMT